MKIENKSINIGKVIFLLILSMIIFLGTLISYGSLELDKYIKNGFILSITILVLVLFYDQTRLLIIKKERIWILLMFFAVLSEIINGRSHIINLMSVTFFVLIAIKLKEQSYKILVEATIIAQFMFFYIYGFQSYFNSYALTTALTGIEIMTLLFVSDKRKLWQLMSVYLSFFVLLFAMESRTSLLAFSIGGAVLILGDISKMNNNKYIAKCAIIFFGIFFLWKYNDLIYNFFFNKWSNLGYKSTDLTSGRFDMWKDVILHQRSLMGHGENFIMDKYSHQDLHNIFIQVLGKYGEICLVVFMVWFVDLIRKIINLSSTYRFLFLSFFLFYFVAGMTENVLFLDCKVFMIVFCFLVNLAWLYKVSYDEKYKTKIYLNEGE